MCSVSLWHHSRYIFHLLWQTRTRQLNFLPHLVSLSSLPSLQWSVHHWPGSADMERHAGVSGRRWVRKHWNRSEGYIERVEAQVRRVWSNSTDGTAWYLGFWPEIMWMSNISIYGVESFSINYNHSCHSLRPLHKQGDCVFLQWSESKISLISSFLSV